MTSTNDRDASAPNLVITQAGVTVTQRPSSKKRALLLSIIHTYFLVLLKLRGLLQIMFVCFLVVLDWWVWSFGRAFTLTIPTMYNNNNQLFRSFAPNKRYNNYSQPMRAFAHENICSSGPLRAITPHADTSPLAYDKAITRNMPHLRKIEQRPSMLMHVQGSSHGSSILFIPKAPSPCSIHYTEPYSLPPTET